MDMVKIQQFLMATRERAKMVLHRKWSWFWNNINTVILTYVNIDYLPAFHKYWSSNFEINIKAEYELCGISLILLTKHWKKWKPFWSELVKSVTDCFYNIFKTPCKFSASVLLYPIMTKIPLKYQQHKV